MHEKLNQFVRNDVWELAPRLEIVHVRHKMDIQKRDR